MPLTAYTLERRDYLRGAVDRAQAALPAQLSGDPIAQVLLTLALEVAEYAEAHLMSNLRTSQQVADELGITSSLVRRRADERQVGYQIGSRDRVFTPEDVARLGATRPYHKPQPAKGVAPDIAQKD